MAATRLFALIVPLLVSVTWRRAAAQTGGTVSYSLAEEGIIGEIIGSIITDANLDARYSSDALGEMRFQFLTEPDITIAIGYESGVLRTSGRVDRESVAGCRHSETCVVSLDIAVRPIQYFQIIKVRIEIVDINDNRPQFDQMLYEHGLKESTSVGSSFVVPSAVDPDSPANSVQTYKLTPEDDHEEQIFALKVSRNLDGTQRVKLQLVRQLDRETKDQYAMLLQAIDGGTPAQTGTIEIFISVLDSNDNVPEFTNSTYEVTVRENAPLHSTVIQVQAIDRDIGDNGIVQYMFSPQTKQAYGHIFDIDPDSGEIFVVGRVDHEENVLYNLMVTAQDIGPDSEPRDTNVIVHVEDTNDNAPEITVNTLTASGTNHAEIPEDSPVDTFVAHVVVSDKDSGRNGQFDCNLNDNAFRLLRTEYENNYQIVTTIVTDRERMSQYSLALRCQDHGLEPLMSTQHILVEVSDINDHAPEFSQSSYAASIIENNYLGASVITLNASDSDIGRNADISYTLSDNVADVFSIDRKTGTISAKTMIDREQVNQYRFYVMATDNGSPPLSSSASVVVMVEDVNDEKPLFTETGYIFSVKENEEPGTLVGTVTATDADGPPYNEFFYSFVQGSASTNAFMIDPKSGKILTRQRLDREIQPVYHVVVAAKDSEAPNRFSSTASVTIFLNDTNDNSPIFDYPTPFNNTIYISNKVPLGYNITRVRSHDPDTGPNGDISYEIQSGNSEALFVIDPESGIISTNDVLSDVEYKLSRLQIVAQDHGRPKPRSQFADLSIVVNKSIPYHPYGEGRHGILSNQNLLIVISVGCGCAIVVVILIVAIVCIRRQDKINRTHRYNCRMEAIGRLTAKEVIGQDIEKASLKDPCINEKEEVHQLKDAYYTETVRVDKMATPSPKILAKKPHDVQTAHHRDLDQLSTHSAEGSNTDSGRGASEEGDRHYIDRRGSSSLSPNSRSTHSSLGQYSTPAYSYYPHLKAHAAAHSYSSNPPQKLRSFAPEESSACTTPTEASLSDASPCVETQGPYIRPARVLPAHGNGGGGGYASRTEIQNPTFSNHGNQNGLQGSGLFRLNDDVKANSSPSSPRIVPPGGQSAKGLVV